MNSNYRSMTPKGSRNPFQIYYNLDLFFLFLTKQNLKFFSYLHLINYLKLNLALQYRFEMFLILLRIILLISLLV